jgi:osmoprotectant transport system permease protein
MNWTRENWPDIVQALWEHAVLVGVSMAIALAVSLVLGVFTARRPALYAAVIAVTATLYTIPGLALFALLLPILGLGTVPAITGLVLYSLLILTRNIATGLRQVSADIVEAATGMGYGRWRRLAAIELPLALPVIVAGVRICLVMQIGVATVAAYINAGGLGNIIFAGINQEFPEKILVGAGLAALLCVGADWGLRRAERALARRAAA